MSEPMTLFQLRADAIHVASVIGLSDVKASAPSPEPTGASPEPVDTRQLGRYVATAEGWDAEGRTLRTTVSHRIGLTLAEGERWGLARRAGATVWRLA